MLLTPPLLLFRLILVLHPLILDSRLHQLSRHWRTQNRQSGKFNVRTIWNDDGFGEFSDAILGLDVDTARLLRCCSLRAKNFKIHRLQCRKLGRFIIRGLYFGIGCTGSRSRSAADPFSADPCGTTFCSRWRTIAQDHLVIGLESENTLTQQKSGVQTVSNKVPYSAAHKLSLARCSILGIGTLIFSVNFISKRLNCSVSFSISDYIFGLGWERQSESGGGLSRKRWGHA